MFKILDGRDKFYQWDLDRKLIVADSAITQVHFCNRYGNCSLIRVPYEVNGVTVVDVPNVILQDSFALHVYAYDVNYTKQENIFDIVPRTKPEDYVYTEEEVKLWDELEQKLIDIEQVIYADGIEAAVKQYLENNPPQAGATTEEAAQIEQNKADIEELKGEVAAIEIPDVSNFATTGYVDEKIADIDFPEGADLTGYATKSYVDTSISNIEHPTPDLSGYATTGYVDNAVANVSVDLTDYYTKEEVDSAIDAELDKSYFLDFTNATSTQQNIKTDVEMKNFCEDVINGNSVCANIREASDIGDDSYYPAIIQKVDDTTFNVVRASINLTQVDNENQYYIYQLQKLGTGADSWYMKRNVTANSYQLVTTGNLDTTLADYAKTADIPTGGGSGTPEVSIGTTAPTDGSILWINPEENNNYLTKTQLIAGGSMIENPNGTLSTVVGGSRSLRMAGGNVVQTKEGVSAWTNNNPNRGVFEWLIGTNTERTALFTQIGLTTNSFSNTTNYSVEYKVHYGGLITQHKYNLKYASSTQLLFVEDNELFTSLDVWNNGNDYVFYINSANVSNSDFYNSYKISDIKLIVGDVYNNIPIDAAYIPYGSGLDIRNGLIVSTLPLDSSDYENNALVQNSNTLNGNKTGAKVVLGHENTLEASQGSCILGRANNVYGYAVNIAIGDNNQINGTYDSIAIGEANKIYNEYCYALGRVNSTGSSYSYMLGEGLYLSGGVSQTAVGQYNIEDGLDTYTFFIGNGTSESDKRNAMTINGDGNAAFSGTVTSQGADYAEYFEWADGNPEAEDRVGYIVALAGDKIHKAQAGEEVLGIISGTVAVLGDNYEWHWNGKYLTDDFGRVIYDLVDKYSEPTEDEPEPKFLGQVKVPRINPEWDSTKEYKNRANRAEWDTVGMFGKLFVRDDGSCVVGGYATTGADGLATLATGKTNMYVMDRINENIVKVLLK